MKHARTVKRHYYRLITMLFFLVAVGASIYIYANNHTDVLGIGAGAQRIVRTTNDLENAKPVDARSSIDEKMRTMNLKQKVAQMMMVRVPASDAVALQEKYQFGGYILFGNDFENKSEGQVREEIASYQTASSIPLLVGIDEEGGTVNRISPYFREEPFPSPQTLFQLGGYQAITKDTKEKDRFLHSFGINVNFAPVADISTDPSDYMYERSFGQGPKETGQYVQTVIKSMKEDHMGSVVKHFPGYGNNQNSHTEVVHDTRPYETFVNNDFIPFEKAIEAGVDSVLVAHNVVESMDSENPASISKKVHTILRDDLEFKGVIMTDDLIMEGIKAFGTSEEIAVKAVLAGNDMLLSSDPVTQYNAVLKAVQEGTISEKQIDASVKRILTWKYNIGLMS